MVMLVVVGLALAGLAIDSVPASLAAPGKATKVHGFVLRNTVQPGQVVRDRFQVTGPKRRPVVLQHREPGQRWMKVQRARTTGKGQAKVRLTVSRAGGLWVWKARLQNRRWVTLARTSSTTHELRIKVPRRQKSKPASSTSERVRVVTPTSPPPSTSVPPTSAPPSTAVPPTHRLRPRRCPPHQRPRPRWCPHHRQFRLSRRPFRWGCPKSHTREETAFRLTTGHSSRRPRPPAGTTRRSSPSPVSYVPYYTRRRICVGSV